MSLILLNLESNQEIKLDNQNPLVIGRKNIKGCFDKRVSRNHGRITCTEDGKLRLEALHCNPCFFTRNGVPPVLQLNKDEKETLSEGDYLGLLPDAFWFKITSNKEIKPTADNSDNKSAEQGSEENNRTKNLDENKSVTNSEVDKTVLIKAGGNNVSNYEHNKDGVSSLLVPTLDPAINSSGSSKAYGSAEFEKTKLLPLWMYEIDDPGEGDRNSNKRSAPTIWESEKRQKIPRETDRDTKTEVKVKIPDQEFPSTSKVEPVDELPNTASSLKSTDQDQGESSKKSMKEGYENDINIERDDAGRRPICQYEGNCYRQNSQHKAQFCHPGDSDYTPYEERPVCQYGSKCYRRNEKHRVEFRHPPCDSDPRKHSSSHNKIASSPLPPKRCRKNIEMQNYEDDEDEYDLEDPFINDDSSDEYIPSDYEEEEEEEEDLNTSRDDD